MRFEEVVTINTKKSREEIIEILLPKFNRISDKQQRRIVNGNNKIVFIGINASFGSINRYDETIIWLTERENGWTIKADVLYKPSLMFWIGLFLLLFTFLLWLLPIIFYQTQKGSVRDEIRRTLDNIKAEYNNQNIAVANNSADELLKLAELRDKNIITNEEFEKRKKQILES